MLFFCPASMLECAPPTGSLHPSGDRTARSGPRPAESLEIASFPERPRRCGAERPLAQQDSRFRWTPGCFHRLPSWRLECIVTACSGPDRGNVSGCRSRTAARRPQCRRVPAGGGNPAAHVTPFGPWSLFDKNQVRPRHSRLRGSTMAAGSRSLGARDAAPLDNEIQAGSGRGGPERCRFGA